MSKISENSLVNESIKTYEESVRKRWYEKHQEAKKKMIDFFGEYSKDNLIETEKLCRFRIKNTQWDLVYGLFGEHFSIWHKDYPEDLNNANLNHINVRKYNKLSIYDMETLGDSLNSVITKWGLNE